MNQELLQYKAEIRKKVEELNRVQEGEERTMTGAWKTSPIFGFAIEKVLEMIDKSQTP